MDNGIQEQLEEHGGGSTEEKWVRRKVQAVHGLCSTGSNTSKVSKWVYSVRIHCAGTTRVEMKTEALSLLQNRHQRDILKVSIRCSYVLLLKRTQTTPKSLSRKSIVSYFCATISHIALLVLDADTLWPRTSLARLKQSIVRHLGQQQTSQ